MRNALIVLALPALILVGIGALSHKLLFDIDYWVGQRPAVSAFWIALIVAAVFFVAGLIAMALTRHASGSERRKLQIELEEVYKRLRASEKAEKSASAKLASYEVISDSTKVEAPAVDTKTTTSE